MPNPSMKVNDGTVRSSAQETSFFFLVSVHVRKIWISPSQLEWDFGCVTCDFLRALGCDTYYVASRLDGARELLEKMFSERNEFLCMLCASLEFNGMPLHVWNQSLQVGGPLRIQQRTVSHELLFIGRAYNMCRCHRMRITSFVHVQV